MVKWKSTEVAARVSSPPLNAVDTQAYRSLVMRTAYLAQDRADIAETTKQLACK